MRGLGIIYLGALLEIYEVTEVHEEQKEKEVNVQEQ